MPPAEADRLAGTDADAHRYRLGANFERLPINAPHATKVMSPEQQKGLIAAISGSLKKVPFAVDFQKGPLYIVDSG